jgi:hypothetical protein
MALLSEAKADLLPAIRLLGGARDYSFRNWSPSCDATWDGIETCESALWSARRGLELLTRPELVAALSPATLERLKQSLRQHEGRYTTQLDLLSASGQGDPSLLCGNVHASVAACEQAVAADSKAIREQVLPVVRCGQIVPGQFLTPEDDSAEAQQDAERPKLKPIRIQPSFKVSEWLYRHRLQQEIAVLAQRDRRGSSPETQVAR